MTKFVHHVRKVARDATAGPMDHHVMANVHRVTAVHHAMEIVLHAMEIVLHVTENDHRVTANAHRMTANAHRMTVVHRETVSDLPDLQRRSVLSKTLCDLMPTKTESSTKQNSWSSPPK